MAADFLDRVLTGTGFTTKPTDESIEKARDFQLGNQVVNPGMGMGPTNNPGGLIPSYELMDQQKQDYLADFGGERQRILEQVATNRVNQNRFNREAILALPDLREGVTPEGFLSRVGTISQSPELQAVVDRENQRRMRAANAALSAGGLQRSGAAAAAAADATLTPEERAFQIEPSLYQRSQDLASMYRDLPIANMMVADTYNRDMQLADNLERQGETRSQAELLKGQASKEATENMLLNLIKAYGASTAGGGTTIINDITNSFEDLIGDVISRGGDAMAGIGDWLGGFLGDIFDGGDGGTWTGGDDGIIIPPIIPPVDGPDDPGIPGDTNVPGVDVPDVPGDQTPGSGTGQSPAPQPDPSNGYTGGRLGEAPDGSGFFGDDGDPDVPSNPDPNVPDRDIGGVAARWNADLGRWVEIPPNLGHTYTPDPSLANNADPNANPEPVPQPEPAPAPVPEPPVTELPPIQPQPEPAPVPQPEPAPVPQPEPAPPVESQPAPWETDIPDFLQNAEQTFNSLLEQGKIGEDGYVLDSEGSSTDLFWTDAVRQYRDALIAARDRLGQDQEIPDLPDLGSPGDVPGVRDPGQEFEDLIGNLPFPDIGDIINPGELGGGLGSGFAPGPGGAPTLPGSDTPTFTAPGLGNMVLSTLAGYGGREIGDALFDKQATNSWGSVVGSRIGWLAGGGLGAIAGAVLGGVVDSAFGTSDKKNVHAGVATTQPGDDVTSERELESGLKLWGIARRAGDGEITESYMNTISDIDKFLTDSAKAAGFDVSLRNFGQDIPTFGGEVTGKGKDLKRNPTFFGSATEGSEESTRETVTQNMVDGYDKFVDAWLQAAVDQNQITGEAAEAIGNIEGNTTEKLIAFQQALGFDVQMPTAEPADAPTTPGQGLPGLINTGVA